MTLKARVQHGLKLKIWWPDEAGVGRKTKIARRGVGARRSTLRPSRSDNGFRLQLCSHMPKARQGGRARAALLQRLGDEPAHGGDISRRRARCAHAVLIMDQAGWHTIKKLVLTSNVSVVPLPARHPEPNPVENIRRYMRDTGCPTSSSSPTMKS